MTNLTIKIRFVSILLGNCKDWIKWYGFGIKMGDKAMNVRQIGMTGRIQNKCQLARIGAK
jgi:hypothetical protein